MLQDLINFINKIMNNDSSESNSSGSNNAKRTGLRLLVPVVIIIFIIVAGLTSFFIVDETEQSVVLRLGRYNRTLGPGLHFKMPLLIERSYNVPTRIVQNESFGFRTEKADIVSRRSSKDYSNESTMLTGDLNIANVEWIIQYRISDPEAWLFNVDNRSKTIRDISISVVNQLVGDYYITDVLGDARTEIEVEALTLMNQTFKEYNLGININAVRLQNIVPPEGSVQDAFEDVNKAVQDMNRLINEGREEYNKQIPKSRGEADQMYQLAQGYATERINQAEGDVARFQSVLREYNRNPQITRDRIYYETVEEVLANGQGLATTKFIDSNFDNLIPFLPLNSNANQTIQKQ